MAKIVIIGSLPESLINFRSELLTAMVQQGHDVFACAPPAAKNIREQLAAKGVVYQEVSLHRTGINPYKDIKLLVELVLFFRRCRPDVVISYTIKPVVYGSIAAQLSGVKAIFSIVTGLGYAFIGTSVRRRVIKKFAVFLYKSALRHNQCIFFQNPDDRHLFIQKKILPDKNKTFVINGSGVNTDYFNLVPLPEVLVFLLIARLMKDKGVDEYVQAARIIKRRYPDIKFKLVGWHDTNPAAVHRSEITAWVNEGVLEYQGSLADVRPAIAACSVYVLPSYREGTPRTVLEAMAMGRPIITTDAPGCRETVVDGENGYLVSVKNVPELVERMQRFIESPALITRMGKASRIIAEEKYDVHKVNAVMMKAMGLATTSQ